jgi:hypothetical protein
MGEDGGRSLMLPWSRTTERNLCVSNPADSELTNDLRIVNTSLSNQTRNVLQGDLR